MKTSNKVVMFCGKGGVGKTTCAGAAALHYAMQGLKTLIISTDPAPSLAHLFQTEKANDRVQVQENLFLSELGLNEIRQMWDRKFGQEVYEVFSSFVDVEYPDFVDFMSSVLPGLADEFMVDYIRELSGSDEYDRIVWDTAPLGQTLGLLETPAMLRKHLKPAPRIYSSLKLGASSKRPVLEILKSWEKLSGKDIDFLREQVDFTLVTIAESLAVSQIDGILEELSRFDFKARKMVVNNVIPENEVSGLFKERAETQQRYLRLIQNRYSDLQITLVPLFSQEIQGAEKLRLVEKQLFME